MSLENPVKLIIKYWSSLMALVSAGFLTGSWVQGRAVATTQAIQAKEISDANDALHEVSDSLHEIAHIEADHTTDIATVKQQMADLKERVDRKGGRP